MKAPSRRVAGRPTAEQAAALAHQLGAAGVAVLAFTADGRVAFAQAGLRRSLGLPGGWLPDGAAGRLADVFREIQDGAV